jgi:hypothetical protein
MIGSKGDLKQRILGTLTIRLIHTDIKVYQIKLKQSSTIVPTLRINYACCMGSPLKGVKIQR